MQKRLVNHIAMYFFRVSSYLHYLVFAGHRKGHGIHSPFAFNIISGFFRNKTCVETVNIRKLRREMKNDKRTINVHDMGAGAVRGAAGSYHRHVADIVRHSSVPEKYGLILAQMARNFGTCIIELGTSAGISTLYMWHSDTEIHTIEGCPETAAIARENFGSAKADINLHVGSFDDVLPLLLDTAHPPGLVFIDGNHRAEPLLKYFGLVAGCAGSNTAVIIDDIHLSREMQGAWKQIKQHTGVSLTIDLHRMGIVFFRKGINNNHFVVRY